jgi:hypothetical protein
MDNKKSTAIIIHYVDKQEPTKIKAFMEIDEELTMLEMDVVKRAIKDTLRSIHEVRENTKAKREKSNESGKAVRK